MSFWSSVWDAAESLATSATTPSKQPLVPATEASRSSSSTLPQTPAAPAAAEARSEEPLKTPLSPGPSGLVLFSFALL